MKALVIGTEISSLGRIVSAALALADRIDLVVFDTELSEIPCGVDRVFVLDTPGDRTAESIVCGIRLSMGTSYDRFIAGTDSAAKNILPRLAGELDIPMVSDVVSVDSPTIVERPIYAGNAVATVTLPTKLCISIRASSFEAVESFEAQSAEVIPSSNESRQLSTVVSRELTVSAGPELSTAHTVVSGGRGVGSRAGFDDYIRPLAEALEAAVGASRAAVDSGYVGNELQVGQTGKIVAPDLYLAVGLSGAIQHIAGMKGSKVIVAINKDPDAPIFDVADYGLIGDLFEVVPQLTQELVQSGLTARS